MTSLQERYQILSELGRGGMGVVYKAKDKMLGRVVAVKRLHKADNQILIDRFLSEAKSIAALNHPNIIQIYDIGQDSEGLYITTEFVDGTDLEKMVKKRKLPPKVAYKIFVPVCQALEYAHQQGVIHRDIKPANILVTQGGAPKVADFGLARMESMVDQEQTGMIMGTRAYASPEQFTDAKHVDHRTDIYSLGAMFYEMLTGKSPQFFRESDIPAAFRKIILQSMERDLQRRYGSVKAVLRDLAAVARGRPASKPAPTPTPEPAQQTILGKDEVEMVLVPAGAFRFGPDGRLIELPAFYIDKFPVTNARFAALVPGFTYPPGLDDHPATKVTWLDANAYARQVGKRLPTEAEWEKAARGDDGRVYPWGNEFSPERANTFESKIGMTTPVDAYPDGASPCGALDMAGNVWEWTSTWLDRRKHARVLKGGAFNGEAKHALCHARFAYPEKGLLPAAGFRCVRSAGG